MDLVDLGARRVMVVTDPNLAKLPPVATVLESLEREKVEFSLFDRVRIEPTDGSFQEAIAFAGEGSIRRDCGRWWRLDDRHGQGG